MTNMSKISEQKALEAYPMNEYEFDKAKKSDIERKRFAYIKGYDKAMQDFLDKAEEYLRKEFVDMWLRYIRGHSMDDEIKMFKNYMQDESEN